MDIAAAIKTLRYTVGDFGSVPIYSDDEIQARLVIASKLVLFDCVGIGTAWAVSGGVVSPEPSSVYVSLTVLRAALEIQITEARKAAAKIGHTAKLGPASIDTQDGILPFAAKDFRHLYGTARDYWKAGNMAAVRVILGPAQLVTYAT